MQSQASWFVVTGRDFVLDAHNVGGIDGNGQVSVDMNRDSRVPRLIKTYVLALVGVLYDNCS